MPRRKPASAKQRKAELQLKRAIKRGDLTPQQPVKPIDPASKLQSAFVKLDQTFLAQTKVAASTVQLSRPIASDVCILTTTDDGLLAVPKRPKWRFDMTKKEVERNEEGWFQKWLDETDNVLAKWPDGPTNFERNLDVWRQLWRVTEISQLTLVLLDSRCPLLHFPPSLAVYLQTKPVKTILVLTKVDIAGPDRVDAWYSYLHAHYPNTPIVPVEAYAERIGAQGKSFYEPHIPLPFRERLVNALRDVHAQMLHPPEHVQNTDKWNPPVKQDIDWDAVLKAEGGLTGTVVGGAALPKSNDEHAYLTIGLIGQPNVGKSSLLNALFGLRKVRASRTPGKTKHFQTLFWTKDVRLVDCPGLVMPALVPMQAQVLSGILPISRVSAIAYCISHVSQLIPLESVLQLTHPSTQATPVVDKRTWRDGRDVVEKEKEKVIGWTAMDVLTAYALKKGWVTAKAGRPDINRAGNAILRAVAEGRIKWAFWPPDTSLETIERVQRQEHGSGIWIPSGVQESDDESDEHEDDEQVTSDEEEVKTSSDSEVDEEEAESDNRLSASMGRFGMLSLDE